MKRTSLWRILVTISVAVASAWVAFYTLKPTRAQGRGWVPFQAVMLDRQYVTGTVAPVRSEEFLYARRTDGSTVEQYQKQLMANGGWTDLRILTDYAVGARISIDPSTESLTSYPYPAAAIARFSTPPGSCSNDPGAQHIQILGYDTIVVERTLPGPTAETTNKIAEWVAPQLNCFALQTKQDFGARASVTREALLVSEGDPPVALFEIPAGYLERSPSELMTERARRFPDDQAAQAAVSRSQVLDNAYHHSRTPPSH